MGLAGRGHHMLCRVEGEDRGGPAARGGHGGAASGCRGLPHCLKWGQVLMMLYKAFPGDRMLLTSLCPTSR